MVKLAVKPATAFRFELAARQDLGGRVALKDTARDRRRRDLGKSIAAMDGALDAVRAVGTLATAARSVSTGGPLFSVFAVGTGGIATQRNATVAGRTAVAVASLPI